MSANVATADLAILGGTVVSCSGSAPVEATVVVTGGPTRYPAGFKTIGLWAESSGVRLGGPHREVFPHMPIDNDDTKMVIELQIPIVDDM